MDVREREARAFDYVLGLLLEGAGEDVRRLVAYEDPDRVPGGTALVSIVPSGFFGEGYGTKTSLPSLPLEQVDGAPLLFGTPRVERDGGRLIVHADIVASSFFLATRYEEVARRDVRDEHGRFPGAESLPARAGFLERPLVDEYASLLRRWLTDLGVTVPPTRRRFRALLTHDVDYVRLFGSGPLAPLRTAVHAWRGQRRPREVLTSLAVSLRLRSDPYDTFGEIAQLDAGAGVGSDVTCEAIHFFMAAQRGPHDGMYDIGGPAARRAIGLLQEAGARVGLHASYAAGRDPSLLAHERAALEAACGQPVIRNRHHFLAWREPEDGWEMARAGLVWDSTLGYSDRPGFRLGVCRPIELLDPMSLEPFGIEEHPLVLMDCTLSRPDCLGLPEEEAFERASRLMDQARTHDGEFVALWHNNVFDRAPENVYLARLYGRLVEALA